MAFQTIFGRKLLLKQWSPNSSSDVHPYEIEVRHEEYKRKLNEFTLVASKQNVFSIHVNLLISDAASDDLSRFAYSIVQNYLFASNFNQKLLSTPRVLAPGAQRGLTPLEKLGKRY